MSSLIVTFYNKENQNFGTDATIIIKIDIIC